MGGLTNYLRAYLIYRRCAKAADLLWKYYGLQITDEIRHRLMYLSVQAFGELSPHALALIYLSTMLEEYEGDPDAPIVHASVEFLLRRANAANAGKRQRNAFHFQRLREIAVRKYGWQP